jgi:parallel beta-helix repeat protein
MFLCKTILGDKNMVRNAGMTGICSGAWKVRCIALLSAAFIILTPSLLGQTFKSTTYQAGSQTAGIQEAIDAAAKVGGGTVQISAGSFVLHAVAGHPAITLRSGVNVVGAGADSTILKLEPNSKVYPSVIANQNYNNPDAAVPDHDIILQGFTIDGAAADQVVHQTQLTQAIPVAGQQPVVLQSSEGVSLDALIRVDPGPDEEIVPVLKASSGTFQALFMRPHPAGANVVVLRDRLHGLALVGAQNVTVQDVTIKNINMDGIYLTNSVDPNRRHAYCKKINIQHSNFIACHRNGISVIDAEDVTIAGNKFYDITGDPGAAVDIEPNYPEQHGNRIAIRDNMAHDCYLGFVLSLQNSGPASENFREDSLTGNDVVATLLGEGIYIGAHQGGVTVSRNNISGTAKDGIYVLGSSDIQVTDNKIVSPGRCHTQRNCNRPPTAVGIRLNGTIRNRVTGNMISDDQSAPTLLYGVEFVTTAKGTGNSIQRNVVSHHDPSHGMVVHVTGNVGSNAISENSKQ